MMSSPEITNQDLLEGIASIRRDFKCIIDALETRLLLKLEETSQNFQEVRNENIYLRKRLDYLERKERKNNIVISGLENACDQDIPTFIVSELNRLLGVPLQTSELNNVFYLGRSQKLVKVEFLSYLTKQTILKNCYKLKNTGIYINNDLSVSERDDNRVLRYHRKLCFLDGKRAYIKKGELWVNDRHYTAEELKLAEKKDEEPVKPANSDPGTGSIVSTPLRAGGADLAAAACVRLDAGVLEAKLRHLASSDLGPKSETEDHAVSAVRGNSTQVSGDETKKQSKQVVKNKTNRAGLSGVSMNDSYVKPSTRNRLGSK